MRLFLAALSLALFSSCVSVPEPTPEQRRAAASFQPRPGEASLYVYRPSGFVGGGAVHPIHIDGNLLGNNASGTFLFTRMTPGRHTVSAGLTQVVLNATPGNTYFLHHDAIMNMAQGHTSTVTLVSNDRGRKEITQCKQASSNF